MKKGMQKFSNMGVDSCLDVVSLENCEYVAQLLAVEKTFPYYQRSPHDRDIVLRLCSQFEESDVPELKGWAIAQLHREQQDLEKQIQDCQVSISVMSKLLKQLEAKVSHGN